MKNAIKNKLVKNKEKKMNKEYFNERTERLHFEITTNLLDRDYVREKANEIFERLPKTDDEFEFLGITEKNIEHYKKNNNPEQLELPDEAQPIFYNYIFLYQIYVLLQDKKKQNEIVECFCSIFKDYPENTKGIRENPFKFAHENHNKYYVKQCANTSDMISLFCYSEYSNESIDEIIDSYLPDLIIAYFKHEHIPRGLFHTDKTYNNEVIMKESYIEDKVQSDISTMIFINNKEGNKTEFNEIEALLTRVVDIPLMLNICIWET